MAAVFDASDYVRLPIVNVAGGFALGSALLSASPKSPTPEVRKYLKRVRKSVVDLQTEWLKREQAGPAENKRPADARADASWGALFSRIEAWSWLPTDEYADAARAGEILATVFSGRLAFLTLPYNEEWAESARRLRLIDDTPNLASDIDRIAGPTFLAEVRRAHEIYGKAIGVTKAVDPVDEAQLAAALRAVQTAIVAYAIRVVGMLDDDDEQSIATVRAALAPIDAHRAAMAARRPSPAEPATPPVDPNTPVPELPPTK